MSWRAIVYTSWNVVGWLGDATDSVAKKKYSIRHCKSAVQTYHNSVRSENVFICWYLDCCSVLAVSMTRSCSFALARSHQTASSFQLSTPPPTIQAERKLQTWNNMS
jgi:hypothetical protein